MVLNDSLCIANKGRRNALTVSVLAVLSGILAIAYLRWTDNPAPLVGYFWLIASLCALLIGLVKQFEPEQALRLGAQTLTYVHKYGQWSLPWQAIQRVGQPRVLQGLEHQTLSYVAIRLKDPHSIIGHITPRLANRLMLQQRPLLLLAEQSCPTGQCYSASMLEDDEYRLPDGRRLHGLQAMFAHRQRKLREALGYDLFIETQDLAMPAERVIALLNAQHQLSLIADGPASALPDTRH